MVERIRQKLSSTGLLNQSTTRTGKDGRDYNIEKIQKANKERTKKTTTSETTTTKEVVEEPGEEDPMEEHEVPKQPYKLEKKEAPEPEHMKDRRGGAMTEPPFNAYSKSRIPALVV